MSTRSHRDQIADVLRNLAPGHPAERIWGRAKDQGFRHGEKRMVEFDPDSTGPAGNVWAGSPEEIADTIMPIVDAAVRQARADYGLGPEDELDGCGYSLRRGGGMAV